MNYLSDKHKILCSALKVASASKDSWETMQPISAYHGKNVLRPQLLR